MMDLDYCSHFDALPEQLSDLRTGLQPTAVSKSDHYFATIRLLIAFTIASCDSCTTIEAEARQGHVCCN